LKLYLLARKKHYKGIYQRLCICPALAS